MREGGGERGRKRQRDEGIGGRGRGGEGGTDSKSESESGGGERGIGSGERTRARLRAGGLKGEGESGGGKHEERRRGGRDGKSRFLPQGGGGGPIPLPARGRTTARMSTRDRRFGQARGAPLRARVSVRVCAPSCERASARARARDRLRQVGGAGEAAIHPPARATTKMKRRARSRSFRRTGPNFVAFIVLSAVHPPAARGPRRARLAAVVKAYVRARAHLHRLHTFVRFVAHRVYHADNLSVQFLRI